MDGGWVLGVYKMVNSFFLVSNLENEHRSYEAFTINAIA